MASIVAGKVGFGDTESAALKSGLGTATAPYAMGTTANTNVVGNWAKTTALSGDSRLLYARLYFAGAGVSGEAARLYGTVDNVTAAVGGTVNGAHISLSVQGASGAISGAGHALRATLDLGAAVNPGGTIDVAQFDTNIAADATIPGTAAFLSFDNVGSGKLAYLFRAANMDTSALFTAAGTGANSAAVSTGGVASKALKVSVNGVDYWLPLFSSNSN